MPIRNIVLSEAQTGRDAISQDVMAHSLSEMEKVDMKIASSLHWFEKIDLGKQKENWGHETQRFSLS